MIKKILLLGCLALLAVSMAFAQAKKPRLMVIPSDIYCQRNGFMNDGIPDYRKAFLTDPDVRLVISELSTIMAKRGFPLENLEQTLKNLAQKELERGATVNKSGAQLAESELDKIIRMAGPDIILDLDFIVKKHGPQKFIHFNLQGLDAYTGVSVAAASGEGTPSTAASVGILLEEAVLNYMDNFNAALMTHFNDLFANGRETVVEVRVWDDSSVNLSSPYEFMGEQVTLGDVIEYWMSENCVQGRFSRVSGSENQITYKQVRIPLFKTVLGKERSIDARGFVGGLSGFLTKAPFNIPCSITERGLGEAHLVIGKNE